MMIPTTTNFVYFEGAGFYDPRLVFKEASMKFKALGSETYLSTANKIEVIISHSSEGAPYCILSPDLHTIDEGSALEQIVAFSACGYIMSDSGYAESYPMFSSDETDS